MKYLTSVILFLGTCLVVWLFYNTANETKLRYKIYNDPDGLTYMINMENGSTWRFYRNYDKNNDLKDEGWTPVLYKINDYNYALESEALQANLEDTSNQRELRSLIEKAEFERLLEQGKKKENSELYENKVE